MRIWTLSRPLDHLLHVFHGFQVVNTAHDRFWLVAINQRIGIPSGKFELVEMFLFRYVQCVTTIVKLVNRRVTATNSVIVMHADAFQVFYETPLKVARSRSLDGCVNETLATGHA